MAANNFVDCLLNETVTFYPPIERGERELEDGEIYIESWDAFIKQQELLIQQREEMRRQQEEKEKAEQKEKERQEQTKKLTELTKKIKKENVMSRRLKRLRYILHSDNKQYQFVNELIDVYLE